MTIYTVRAIMTTRKKVMRNVWCKIADETLSM